VLAAAAILEGPARLGLPRLAEESLVAPPRNATRPWRLVEGKHWQIVSSYAEDISIDDASEPIRGSCAPDMVEVQGALKVDGWGYSDLVDALQATTCESWIDRTFPERCARFDANRWHAVSGRFGTEPMHFCIDRFEYPNRRGEYPWIMVSWHEAVDLCKREDKRLCTEAEWTLACEGDDAMPYPNGYERDADACVIDRPARAVDAQALAARDTARARAEVDRLWQGEASGARPRCRSPFGVYDLTGNVDEWTVSAVAGERPSVLKGGYWAPVRGRCRASTRAHDEDFYYYQQGFRCCADAEPANDE
jgi:hypothetical protein